MLAAASGYQVTMPALNSCCLAADYHACLQAKFAMPAAISTDKVNLMQLFGATVRGAHLLALPFSVYCFGNETGT
jgi:hypothetical protein